MQDRQNQLLRPASDEALTQESGLSTVGGHTGFRLVTKRLRQVKDFIWIFDE